MTFQKRLTPPLWHNVLIGNEVTLTFINDLGFIKGITWYSQDTGNLCAKYEPYMIFNFS